LRIDPEMRRTLQLEDKIIELGYKGLMYSSPKDLESLEESTLEQMYDLYPQYEKSAYLKDDRKDIYQLQIPGQQKELQLAKCVASLWDANDIGPLQNGKRSLSTKTLMERMNNRLSLKENFINQPTGAYGTGFLVKSPEGKKNWIVTAGHCIKKGPPIEDIRFVFGFSFDKKDSDPCEVNDADIYTVGKVIVESTNPDYAIVELKNSVENQEVAEMNFDDPLGVNANLYIIGHPACLPKKLSYGRVKKCKSNSFVAQINAWEGNSGSPLFNAVTHKVEGILVSGPEDQWKTEDNIKKKYVQIGSKLRSRIFNWKECQDPNFGEICILTSCLQLYFSVEDNNAIKMVQKSEKFRGADSQLSNNEKERKYPAENANLAQRLKDTKVDPDRIENLSLRVKQQIISTLNTKTPGIGWKEFIAGLEDLLREVWVKQAYKDAERSNNPPQEFFDIWERENSFTIKNLLGVLTEMRHEQLRKLVMDDLASK